ncbi:MAG: (deoxy)nucleoside triphosphate pyrophosphohydrolase [Methanobacteriaceae archaeon]|nr:(deoxy)nucleoside triphosphate pyrophosphohydrolase [Methanobacteriaceae archaeon]
MKSIEVVAAIIKKDNQFLATQRGYGEFINMWEFPGGKIESGETQKEALIREIQEELNATIKPEKFLLTIKYTYPTFHLTMHCYLCKIIKGQITLLEHNAGKWLTINELDTLEWLPADVEVVDYIKEKL